MSMASSIALTEALISRTEDVETGVDRGTKVGVKETGTIVTVDQQTEFEATVIVNQYPFARTNFFIEETLSRKYFKGRKLTRYLYFSKITHYAFIGLSIIIILGAPFNYVAAFLMLPINVFYVMLFFQHIYVNIQTMRHVLKQPGVPDHTLSTSNAHLEITLEEYAASYAASQQAGLGLIDHGKGTVKIQVFQYSAKRKMWYCILLSSIYFTFAILEILYCVGFVGFGGVAGGGVLDF